MVGQDDHASPLSHDGIDEAISVVVRTSTEIVVENQAQVITFTMPKQGGKVTDLAIW
jgi:hypothetical protein